MCACHNKLNVECRLALCPYFFDYFNVACEIMGEPSKILYVNDVLQK